MTNKQSGFTLIETFGAITILILAVLGPLSLLSANIADGALIKSQITASHLAQEAIELVINKRDQNAFLNQPGSPVDWLDGLRVCANNICSVEVPSDTGPVADALSCASNDNCQLVIDDAGIYRSSFNTSGNSLFSREVTIQPFDMVSREVITVNGLDYQYFGGDTFGSEGEEGALVTVVVRWKFKILDKKYSLSTVIYKPTVNAVEQP